MPRCRGDNKMRCSFMPAGQGKVPSGRPTATHGERELHAFPDVEPTTPSWGLDVP